jgi:hypothetical protein
MSDKNYIEKKLDIKIQDGTIILDGFNDCVIGYDSVKPRLIYDTEKMVEELSKDTTEEEAWEYINFNIINVKYPYENPIFTTVY